MDPRFKKINELFINYSLGNFDYSVELSPKLDEIDAFISNINMLGEELKATTISKDYFNNIFNSVSDIIFIMDDNGNIRDMNSSGYALFGLCSQKIDKINIFHLFKRNNELTQFKNNLKKSNVVVNMRAKLKHVNGKALECIISAHKLNKEMGVLGYQGIIKDITKEKETENLVIRTIVNTQEQERERFARDLHDSLGQQLSTITYSLSTLKNLNTKTGKKYNDILSQSAEAIIHAKAELRKICFNLMPGSLEDFGLTYAIAELCNKMESAGGLSFVIRIKNSFPELDKSLEVAIFRIVQEFISNAIKHGKASEICIGMKISGGTLGVILHDNGIGFNMKKLSKFEGMGLRNIKSRVGSYNGEVKITSAVKKGTSYRLIIPLQ